MVRPHVDSIIEESSPKPPSRSSIFEETPGNDSWLFKEKSNPKPPFRSSIFEETQGSDSYFTNVEDDVRKTRLQGEVEKSADSPTKDYTTLLAETGNFPANQPATDSYSFEENPDSEPRCDSYFSDPSSRPSGFEETRGNNSYRRNSTSSTPTILRMVPSKHHMRRNLVCESVDNDHWRYRIAKE